MSNRLEKETSPYLLQHSSNPVDWYPWCDEAFSAAKIEDKPVMLSIGYSSCHWCHVMAHESFEDQEIADILNRSFICIKVDREERPDIDSIYMSVCQAFTGSGGWPMTVFMTGDQRPFFAGTYFPKTSHRGMMGFKELLLLIEEKWQEDASYLLQYADEAVAALKEREEKSGEIKKDLIDDGFDLFKKTFDSRCGGFGDAPKFPSPHNLMFLLTYYKKYGDEDALKMAEKTLVQLYRGGQFDHIGYGFCRYSTDRFFLVPHFEKMLYDNALLMQAYALAYSITEKPLYRDVAEKIGFFVMEEMISPEGAFFSAKDADSEGEEAKYYVWDPDEIIGILGEEKGRAFNAYFDITEKGNFEGENIPHLLKTKALSSSFDDDLPELRSYRRHRTALSTDDKILTSWNALMIAGLSLLYRISGKEVYLDVAQRAQRFIEARLCDKNTLYVSFREGRRGTPGYLDDYANYIFALLCLYDATLEPAYLHRAGDFAKEVVDQFFDHRHGGFFLYGKDREALILRPKESYDGAMPSGNSMMSYNLVRLKELLREEYLPMVLQKQLAYMSGKAEKYPAGYGMFLLALSHYFDPPEMITAVTANHEKAEDLPFLTDLDALITLLSEPTKEHPLVNDAATYYICRGKSCLAPTNDPKQLKLRRKKEQEAALT